MSDADCITRQMLTFQAEDAEGEGVRLMLKWERTRVLIPVSAAGS